MSNYNITLKDENNNLLYPKTLDFNVYNSNNQSLDNVLLTKANNDASNLTSSNVTSWNNALHTEQVDLVYDKDSNDSSINWGYTSGLVGGTAITGKNLTKYKRLRFYYQVFYNAATFPDSGGFSNVVEMDLSHSQQNLCCVNPAHTHYYFQNGTTKTGTDVFGASFNYKIASNYNLNIYFSFNGNLQTSNVYFVYKIEGVY